VCVCVCGGGGGFNKDTESMKCNQSELIKNIYIVKVHKQDYNK